MFAPYLTSLPWQIGFPAVTLVAKMLGNALPLRSDDQPAYCVLQELMGSTPIARFVMRGFRFLGLAMVLAVGTFGPSGPVSAQAPPAPPNPQAPVLAMP